MAVAVMRTGATILSLLLWSSCGTPGGTFPIQSVRGVLLFARSTEPNAGPERVIEGKVPLEVAAILSHSFGENDPHNDDAISKADLDFGDGNGWSDFTVDLRTKWWKEPLTLPVYHPDWMTHHTYAEPGTYTINGRMNYWDGEVVYASSSSLVTVIVHPPAAQP